MMAFDVYLRSLLERAAREAQNDGSTTVEAQHLLLAMAASDDAELGPFLDSLGLEHGAVRAALHREFEHALGAAGVPLGAAPPPRAKSPTRPAGNLGTSVQHALERGLEGLRETPQPGHVLLGVLQANVGVVPRALELAGVDRSALVARVRDRLAGGRAAGAR